MILVYYFIQIHIEDVRSTSINCAALEALKGDC
jgi:hypothetical protein